MTPWRFDIRPQRAMPPLAWVAAVRPGDVSIDCGMSVRTFDTGFFEGTWVGQADPALLPESTTVFGSGIVLHDGNLMAIPPTHHLECIYLVRVGDALVVSNSLTGTLASSGLALDPRADYSTVFLGAVRAVWLIDEPSLSGDLRLRYQQFEIPTTTTSITGWFVENVLIEPDLSTRVSRRPREASFTDFADYKARLTSAAASLFANARRYEPVVALSGGYDSAAVGAVAAAAGARSAVGFTTGRPPAGGGSDYDSGASTAAALGLDFETFDRLAYRSRTDLADADLLASGMAAEDVVFLSLESTLRSSLMLNGYWAGTEFAFADRNGWSHVSPITTSGADMTEYRLRADFAWVPLPVFGAIRTLDAPNLLDRSEMDPFRVGGKYDRPIPRRLAEEAGVKRGTFAVTKRAASVLPPRHGLDAFSAAARESIQQFAAARGEAVSWPPRRPFSRYERGAIRWADRLQLAPIARPLERRQTGLTHFEPRLGNVLLRWAVSVVSERYGAVQRAY